MGGELNRFPGEVPNALANYVKEKIWDMDPEKRATMAEVQF